MHVRALFSAPKSFTGRLVSVGKLWWIRVKAYKQQRSVDIQWAVSSLQTSIGIKCMFVSQV